MITEKIIVKFKPSKLQYTTTSEEKKLFIKVIQAIAESFEMEIDYIDFKRVGSGLERFDKLKAKGITNLTKAEQKEIEQLNKKLFGSE